MKVNLISAVLLFALAGCGKDKQSTDEFVTINVSKDYPETTGTYSFLTGKRGKLYGK